MLTFGKRDAFRKLRIFKAGWGPHIATGVKSYVSVPDNDAPVLFVQPYFWGRNGWLVMNKISVMVDGEVIFEHECGKVERDTEGVGVGELCNIAPSKEEIDALRKVVDSAKVVVRLTGEKGYARISMVMLSTIRSTNLREICNRLSRSTILFTRQRKITSRQRLLSQRRSPCAENSICRSVSEARHQTSTANAQALSLAR